MESVVDLRGEHPLLILCYIAIVTVSLSLLCGSFLMTCGLVTLECYERRPYWCCRAAPRPSRVQAGAIDASAGGGGVERDVEGGATPHLSG